MSLKTDLTFYRHRVEQNLKLKLLRHSIQPSLQNAMQYSVLNGGKRVRPILVYLVNKALGGSAEAADSAACAIECLHSYSLVHDDLPAMDDDELRRGEPTCHIAFDEATAILAGDALQCIAFEWLTDPSDLLTAEQQIAMVRTLSIASGDLGMIAGQAFDLASVDQSLSYDQLRAMHRCKTGALINAAITLGIISAGVDPKTQQDLIDYGSAIGLAFQVKDDILDIESDTQTLGKPQGSDIESNKPTYPALLGMEGAKQKLDQLYQQALAATATLGDNGEQLRALATYIVERNH